MNYYNEIKNKLIDNEIYEKVKDYSKERNKVKTYFEIGKILNEAGGKYGDKIIEEYSKKLMIEVGKKYNKSTLFRIKQFYNIFKNQKVATLSQLLTWSHYVELLPLKDINKIEYYINITKQQNLGVRELREKIKNQEYERLDENTKEKLKTKKEYEIEDYIKHPIIIKNTNDYESISEKQLQKLILEDIPSFLKELGNGFTFIDNEYKIKIGDNYNYIDLLLFNYIYNCFVVIELKTTELKKEHIGQIEIYMNYIDKNVKTINQNKTIGIIICKKENKFVLEYCSDSRIYETTYMLVNENNKEYKIKQVDKQTNVYV
jgi:predicted nuclease of restriction endonuclease-like (RecB) superfamily